MSRTLRDTVASDAAASFRDWGEPATYQASPGAEPIDVTVVEDHDSLRREGKEGRSVEGARHYQLLRSAVDDPVVHAVLVVNDRRWVVTGIPARDSATTTVRVESRGYAERTRPRLREEGRGFRGE